MTHFHSRLDQSAEATVNVPALKSQSFHVIFVGKRVAAVSRAAESEVGFLYRLTAQWLLSSFCVRVCVHWCS